MRTRGWSVIIFATALSLVPTSARAARSAYWTQGQFGTGPLTLNFQDAGTLSIGGTPTINVSSGFWCTRCSEPNDFLMDIAQPVFLYRLVFLTRVEAPIDLTVDAPFDPLDSDSVSHGVFFEADQSTLVLNLTVAECRDALGPDAGPQLYSCTESNHPPYCNCVGATTDLSGPSSSPAVFLIDPSRLPGGHAFKPGDVIIVGVRTGAFPACSNTAVTGTAWACTPSAPLTLSLGSASQKLTALVYAPATIPIYPPRVSTMSETARLRGQAAFSLNVRGTDFVQGAKVSWDTTPLFTNFDTTVDAGTSLTAVVSSDLLLAGGPHYIDVVNPELPDGGGGPSGKPLTFVVVTPVLSPALGPVNGGTRVLVEGVRFDAGVQVLFDGNPATGVAVVSSQQLWVTTPPHAAANVEVQIVNADGPATVPRAFQYLAAPPVLSGLTPNGGSVSGGTEVAVSGSGFQAGATVLIGGSRAIVTMVSDSEIRVTTPAHAAGTADLSVSNPDGQTGRITSAFTFFAQTKTGCAQRPDSSPGSGFLLGIWMVLAWRARGGGHR